MNVDTSRVTAQASAADDLRAAYARDEDMKFTPVHRDTAGPRSREART